MTTVPNSVPDEVRCDHLILLVGGNPLPNAVSGHLLVKPGGRITLIYSEGTLDVARRLADWLRKHAQITVEEVDKRLCVREQEPVSIYKRVQHVLDRGESNEVGLNYTGGTKAMAVHAYRAVEAWATSRNRKAIFSYLDARTNCMIFDHSPWAISVDRQASLQLDDMLALHGWCLASVPVQKPILPETATAIAAAHAADCGSNQPAYAEWKKKLSTSKSEVDWPTGQQLDEVAKALKREIWQGEAEKLNLHQASQHLKMSRVKSFCDWLTGKWLDHYVLHVLIDVLCLTDSQGISVEQPKFELDAATVVGHHLFAFSCTTQTKKDELKLKLFEAVLRARQLGGDHASVALVTVVDSALALEIQNEARQQIDADERIRVFGCAELGQLDHYISCWIEEQVKSKC
jgi:hypothetical protein